MAILVVIAVVWWRLHGPAEESDGVQLEDESFAAESVDDGGKEPPARASDDSHGFPARRAVSPDQRVVREQPAPDPYSEGKSIADVLREAALIYGWSERRVYANKTQWQQWCEEVGPASGEREVDFDRIREKMPGMESRAVFSQLCREFIDEVGADLEQESLLLLDESAQHEAPGIRPQWQLQWENIEELHRVGAQDQAREQIIEQLDQALSVLDEGLVASALSKLYLRGAELIEPPIPGDEGSYHFYFDASFLAAAALICREAGGCHGEQHPLVLRQCSLGPPRNTGCYRPTDLLDAIYQTTTPVEYMAFTALYDQVVSLLVSYRRGQ
ncbi:hypothetical protein IC757_13065 [Wenzhouxiangella sp. AB-CW3]|uniref:hypothetical protein n=1 Tax=Wenzhouxiangella sp. AB-CW3 TaxID=2771012 RepID=UPI00168A59B7|nr:hypothetical protein [Wenzhouxiangella sp. AB-CW3]QOC21951.1 hypothetical protein IC757_13065 [Wenzhouxiangella sp. AB-CW3]